MSHVNALSVFVFLQRSDFTVQLHQIWDSESCPVPAPFWTRRHETCRFNSCITRAPNRKVSCIIETCRDCLWTFYIIYIYIYVHCTFIFYVIACEDLPSHSWTPKDIPLEIQTILAWATNNLWFSMTWQAVWHGKHCSDIRSVLQSAGVILDCKSEMCLSLNLELGNDCFFRQKKTLEKSKENENDTPAIRDSRLGAEGQLDEGRLRRSCDLSMRRDQSSKIRNNSAQVQIQSRHFARRLFTFHSCDLGNKGDSNGSMTTSRVQEIHQHTTSTGPWGKCPWPFGTAAMAPHDTPTWHSDMVPQLGRTWHRDMAPNHNSQA